MTQDQIEKLIASIQAFSKCPTCNAPYEADQIRLVEENANTCLLEMHCLQCHTKALGTVLIQGSAMNQPKVIQKTAKKQIISQNQILEFNQSLKKFDGDFQKLFRSSK